MHKRKSIDNAATSILTGIGTAIVMCIMLTVILSHMLLAQTIGEDSVGIVISAILMISSTIGSIFSAKLSSKQPLKMTAITTIGLVAIQFIGGLVADGVFQDVIFRVIPIAAGGAVGYVICMKKSDKRMKVKMHHR